MTVAALVDVATQVIVFFLLVAVGLDLSTADSRALRRRPALFAAAYLAVELALLLATIAWRARVIHPDRR